MPLDNLRKRFCPVSDGCKNRGDVIGKNNLIEIASLDLETNLTRFHKTVIKIGDIICMKHYMQYYNQCCRNKSESNRLNNEMQPISTEVSSQNITSNYDFLNDYSPIEESTQELSNFETSENNLQNQETIDSFNQENVNNDKTILKIKRGFASHSFCFICKRKTGSKPMTVLPIEAIIDVYIKREILIPLGARSCSDHLSENNYVKDDQIENIPIADISIGLSSEKIKIIFQTFKSRDEKTSSIFNKFTDFTTVTEEICMKITGFTKDELFFISNELKSLINSENRTKLQAIAIYFFWLKTGLKI